MGKVRAEAIPRKPDRLLSWGCFAPANDCKMIEFIK